MSGTYYPPQAGTMSRFCKFENFFFCMFAVLRCDHGHTDYLTFPGVLFCSAHHLHSAGSMHGYYIVTLSGKFFNTIRNCIGNIVKLYIGKYIPKFFEFRNYRTVVIKKIANFESPDTALEFTGNSKRLVW